MAGQKNEMKRKDAGAAGKEEGAPAENGAASFAAGKEEGAPAKNGNKAVAFISGKAQDALALLSKNRAMAFALFAFVSFSFLIHIAGAGPDDYGRINPAGNIWTANDPRMAGVVQLMIAGMGAAVFTVSLLYFFIQILRGGEYEQQLKGELYQIAVTIVWGMAIFGAAVIVNTALQLYAGGDLFDISGTYMARVNCLSVATVMKLEGLKMLMQYFSGLMAKYYAGAWGFKIPAVPGAEVMERAISIIQMLITPFSASLMVQQIGLQVIKATALVFLLPTGLLLRLAPPTREAGSFLMASAFAFYFVFPFTYVINAAVMDRLYQEQYGYPMCGGNESGDTSLVGDFKFYSGTGTELLPITPNGITKTMFLKPMALLDPITALSYVIVQAVFLPALTMVVVVSFVKTVAKFFSQKME